MLDVKRKLESITSSMLPNSSPTFVQAILKRVKGTESWERQNLRKNTQENVAMVQDPEIKFSDYVKPQRKLNISRSPASPTMDDASSSGTGASFDSTEGSKAVQFGKFVEEICYLSCPPDAACVKASEECKAKVLAILGLEASPLACANKGDAVLDAVSKARENCANYPRISMIPINDGGREISKIENVQHEKFPTQKLDLILSCGTSTSTTDSDAIVTSSDDTDSHSHDDDDDCEIIPLHIGDEEEEEDIDCPIRALAIEA